MDKQVDELQKQLDKVMSNYEFMLREYITDPTEIDNAFNDLWNALERVR